MKSRKELIQQHEHLLKVYEKVKAMLSQYPNVVSIGIGIKEKDGKLTDEGCIKVVVKEKKSEAELGPQMVIPKEVDGVKTDVIIYEEKVPQTVCTDHRTDSSRPLKGGIYIKNDRKGSGVGGGGTLGCLAQLVSDDSWVILSNHHVLYGDDGEDGDEIGQPWVSGSWCCKCNVIAKNFDKNKDLDCAIAKVEDDIGIENTILEIGNISVLGTTSAVSGEQVKKRGARTGLTSGTISHIDPVTGEITVDPNPAGGPEENPGGYTNYEAGVTIFTNPGDSGSVYVNIDNEIVGLHHSGAASSNKSFGHDIIRIESALHIKINPTSTAPGRTPESSSSVEPAFYNNQPVVIDRWPGYIHQKLDETSLGQKIKEIIRIHQDEVIYLVTKHRAGNVTWQRKQGPAFIAAFNRSLRNSDYKIPEEINRVSLQNLLMSMATVFEEHGSEALKTDVRKYALDVIKVSKLGNSANDFFDIIAIMDKKDALSPVL